MNYLRPAVISLLALSALVAGVLAVSASDGTTHYDPWTAEAGSLSHGSGHNPVPFAPQVKRTSDLDRILSGLVGAKNPRMSSHVVRLVQAQGEVEAFGQKITALNLSPLAPDLQAMAKARLMRIDSRGRVQAYLLVATTVDEVVADVKRAQGQVERFDESAKIVQALVPIGHLETLAHQPSVKFIRLPDYGIPGVGSVTTQGDSILGADAVRSALAVDGTGVRVGVISDGVAGIASSQGSGDLPTVDTTSCNVVSGSDPTLSGAEGTASLELVHDLAPGAELWFGHFLSGGTNSGGTVLDFNAAVDCLAANTDVVVDDIQWANVGSYDGTSIVSANTSTELNRTSNPIRAYATAVGNKADSHYQEAFLDSGFDLLSGSVPTWEIHRFQATAGTSDAGLALPCDAAFPGILCTDNVFVAPGGFVIFFLQWNDPFGGSSNDYDLFLFDEAGALVDSSLDPQSGSQDPVEVVAGINNSGLGQFFDVVIGRFAGSVRTFDMFVVCGGCALFFNDAIHNFNTLGSSVPNQGDAGGGVISVGAINADDLGNDDIASYSSRGPTNDNRVKPDVTGIDCVSVTGAGGFGSPFCGTSAAAPHIAGIAALLLECNPALLAGESGDSPSGDRTALRDALLNNAVDLGAGGIDNTYGYGRADALASSAAICADSDGDGVFDTIDNCPAVPNEDQADTDSDTVGNACDNCPAWPNTDQSLPPWPIAADDPDCDAWSTADEISIGTLPLIACGVGAWPPDITDSQAVDFLDLNALVPFLFFSAAGNERFNLSVDGAIDFLDLNAMVPFLFLTCSVP